MSFVKNDLDSDTTIHELIEIIEKIMQAYDTGHAYGAFWSYRKQLLWKITLFF